MLLHAQWLSWLQAGTCCCRDSSTPHHVTSSSAVGPSATTDCITPLGDTSSFSDLGSGGQSAAVNPWRTSGGSKKSSRPVIGGDRRQAPFAFTPLPSKASVKPTPTKAAACDPYAVAQARLQQLNARQAARAAAAEQRQASSNGAARQAGSAGKGSAQKAAPAPVAPHRYTNALLTSHITHGRHCLVTAQHAHNWNPM